MKKRYKDINGELYEILSVNGNDETNSISTSPAEYRLVVPTSGPDSGLRSRSKSTWSIEASKTFWNDVLNKRYTLENLEEEENKWNNYSLTKEDIKALIHLARPSPPCGDSQKFTSMDYGCWSGKWSKELIDISDCLISVDMYTKPREIIEKRHHLYADKNNCSLEYYITQGDELRGLGDKTVDFIFSQDSLVRTPNKVLVTLIKEFHRVLKNNGTCLINVSPQAQDFFANCHSISSSSNWSVTQLYATDVNVNSRLNGPRGTGASCYLGLKKELNKIE